MSEMVYNLPTSIYYGWGEVERIGGYVEELGGGKVLVVTDEGVEGAGLLKGIAGALESRGIQYAVFNGVQPNPTDMNVMEGLGVYRESGCDLVVAVGGGSPMDAAKGVILMARHPGELREYYGGEPGLRPVTGDVPPFIAVPTTSGTGSEVSRGGIITDTSENRKRAIGSKHLLPRTVVLDPSLTATMPPRLTAHTGLDALSHSVEAFAVDRYSPICDAFAREGIGLVARSLMKAFEDGGDRRAREDMMIASTLGALAFQKGLGVVHSLAHQLSPQTGIPHGAACGIMMPHAIRFNLVEAVTVEKYAEVARILGAEAPRVKELAQMAPEMVQGLLERLGVQPTLGAWGVTEEDIVVMAKNAMLDHCHPRNPRACTEEDMAALYRVAL